MIHNMDKYSINDENGYIIFTCKNYICSDPSYVGCKNIKDCGLDLIYSCGPGAKIELTWIDYIRYGYRFK